MRKVVLFLAVVGVVTGAVLLFHNTSQAQIPQHRYVNGYTYQEGGILGNCKVQARATGSANWVDVATSNGSGYYTWDPVSDPSYWPDGYIYMRVKPTCDSESGPWADPTDTPNWLYYNASGSTIQVNVHSDYCP
jgi:hypothetical protein